jgi:hypothetical protein
VWGRGRRGTNWPTEVIAMATLCELDENDRFFTAFCNPYIGHTFRLFSTFNSKKDTKYDLRKMPEVIIKLDKILKD